MSKEINKLRPVLGKRLPKFTTSFGSPEVTNQLMQFAKDNYCKEQEVIRIAVVKMLKQAGYLKRNFKEQELF